MTFLRGCKFSLEKTKRKLDMYFTMRAAVPEFFTDRDISRPELQEILNMVYVIIKLETHKYPLVWPRTSLAEDFNPG